MEKTESHSAVPGQVTLPGMAEEMGYEAILLKPAQERFCWEYVLRGDNATRAYMVANGEQDAVKARKNASKLMQNSDILRRIVEVRAELKRKYSATADDLIQYHTKVLKISRDEFLDPVTRKPLPLEDIAPEAMSILEFDIERDTKFNSQHVVFKVPTRHQSAVELARVLGMHKEKFEMTGRDGGPIETASAVTIYIPANGRD